MTNLHTRLQILSDRLSDPASKRPKYGPSMLSMVREELKDILKDTHTPDAREALADKIATIDRELEREEHDSGYRAFVLIRKIWPDLKAAALRLHVEPGGEAVAMLGGINGVSLMRHIKAMQPKAQADYHTPLYKHPPSDERAKVIEECARVAEKGR